MYACGFGVVRAHLIAMTQMRGDRPAAAGGLYVGAGCAEAVRRYTQLWLPLLNNTPEHERASLIPPLDVAFAWLSHRLAPAAYEQVNGVFLHVSLFLLWIVAFPAVAIRRRCSFYSVATE